MVGVKNKVRGLIRKNSKIPKNSVDVQESVPGIVVSCINSLREIGLEEPGLFRVSGSKSQIESLKQQFFKNPNINLLDFNRSPHVIACMLKGYFRDNPPIIPHDCYDAFVAIHEIEDSNEALNYLTNLLQTLTSSNYQTLKYLLHFLKEVASFCEVNKMHASNIAIVFGPNLLRSTSDDMCKLVLDTPIVGEIVTSMIENYELLFEGSYSTGVSTRTLNTETVEQMYDTTYLDLLDEVLGTSEQNHTETIQDEWLQLQTANSELISKYGIDSFSENQNITLTQESSTPPTRNLPPTPSTIPPSKPVPPAPLTHQNLDNVPTNENVMENIQIQDEDKIDVDIPFTEELPEFEYVEHDDIPDLPPVDIKTKLSDKLPQIPEKTKKSKTKGKSKIKKSKSYVVNSEMDSTSNTTSRRVKSASYVKTQKGHKKLEEVTKDSEVDHENESEPEVINSPTKPVQKETQFLVSNDDTFGTEPEQTSEENINSETDNPATENLITEPEMYPISVTATQNLQLKKIVEDDLLEIQNIITGYIFHYGDIISGTFENVVTIATVVRDVSKLLKEIPVSPTKYGTINASQKKETLSSELTLKKEAFCKAVGKTVQHIAECSSLIVEETEFLVSVDSDEDVSRATLVSKLGFIQQSVTALKSIEPKFEVLDQEHLRKNFETIKTEVYRTVNNLSIQLNQLMDKLKEKRSSSAWIYIVKIVMSIQSILKLPLNSDQKHEPIPPFTENQDQNQNESHGKIRNLAEIVPTILQNIRKRVSDLRDVLEAVPMGEIEVLNLCSARAQTVSSILLGAIEMKDTPQSPKILIAASSVNETQADSRVSKIQHLVAVLIQKFEQIKTEINEATDINQLLDFIDMGASILSSVNNPSIPPSQIKALNRNSYVRKENQDPETELRNAKQAGRFHMTDIQNFLKSCNVETTQHPTNLELEKLGESIRNMIILLKSYQDSN